LGIPWDFLIATQDHLRERAINGELKSGKTPKERPLVF
jgi:hypothetical protein